MLQEGAGQRRGEGAPQAGERPARRRCGAAHLRDDASGPQRARHRTHPRWEGIPTGNGGRWLKDTDHRPRPRFLIDTKRCATLGKPHCLHEAGRGRNSQDWFLSGRQRRFSQPHEHRHDDALVRKGLHALQGGPGLLETRPTSLLVGSSLACSGQVDAEATVEDDFER